MNEYFMNRAIDLASKGSGFVNPDPLSGAVIVKDNRIIGEGYYQSYGAISSEQMAINNAISDLLEAELYITIEPNRFESEVLLLILEKGIRRIFIGMRDPNPNKKIDYILELEKSGISYEVGLLGDRCEELNEIYAHYIQHKSPFVIAKWAMTLDGKLATKTGDSKWISAEESLGFVHQLRQRVAAILVGENTVKVDDPLLTTRLEGVIVSNPFRVIISKYGDIPMESKVLQVDDHTKTLIITSEFIPEDKEEALLRKGVQIAKLREVNHRFDFKDILKLLGDMEIDSLFIEGGSSILGAALEDRCIHKIYTTIAPKIIGGKDAVTPIGGNGIELMRNAIVLHRVSHEIIGPDVIIKGYL